MERSLLEITTELIQAQITAGMVFPESVNETLRHTFATLQTLKIQEEQGQATPLPIVEEQPKDWRKSITKSSITCLECGCVVRQLTTRHLLMHGLDSQSYRRKYGIPRSQPLAARETTARRQQIVQEIKPWERSPAYQTGQQRKSALEAVPDVIETTDPKAADRPNRQRSTTSKKKTVRKSKRGK